MKIDIFKDEQRIYDEAAAHAKKVNTGAPFDFEEYMKLMKEYGKLLKQLRRSTRIADRTTFELNENNLDLEDKVHFDALTGIYNRRFMEDNLIHIIRSLSRSGGSLSMLMIDVDYFKKFNDTYGHGEGDVCLKTIAETIEKSLSRGDDFVARYGGEEFVVVLPNTDESGARIMSNKIIKSIIEKNIPHEKNEATGCVTVSIGVTTSEVKHTHSGTDFIKCADKALYMSKQNGRNRYTFMSLEDRDI